MCPGQLSGLAKVHVGPLYSPQCLKTAQGQILGWCHTGICMVAVMIVVACYSKYCLQTGVAQVSGHYAGIDEQGKLIELGWSKWPTLMHLAWQGQWQDYLHNLQANLSKPALTVPVFANQVKPRPSLLNDTTSVYCGSELCLLLFE